MDIKKLENEAARLRTLRNYNIIESGAEQQFEDLAFMAGQICSTPMAAIFLAGRKKPWVKACFGFPLTELPDEFTVLDEALAKKGVWVVSDLQARKRYSAMPLVHSEPHLRFFASASLQTPEGYALGVIAVMDTRPRRLSQQQKKGLDALARQVMALLEARKMLHEVRLNYEAKKRTEFILRRNEQLFKKVFEDVPLGMAFVDINSQIINANRAICYMLGYSESELKKHKFTDFTHPEDMERDFDFAQKLLNNQVSFYRLEKRCIRADHRIIWVNLTGSAIRDDRGRILYGLIMMEDITRQKEVHDQLERAHLQLEKRVEERTRDLARANESLKVEISEREKTENKFRILLESSPDAIVIVDEHGKIVLTNHQADQMFGYEKGELYGKTVEMLIPEPYRERHKELRTAFTRERKTRPMGEGLDLWALTKDGRQIPVEISLNVLEMENDVLVFAAIRDITLRKLSEQRLKESEQKYRLLFEESNDAIFISTPEGKLLDINPSGVSLFGYPSKKALLALDSWRELLADPGAHERLWHALRAHGRVKDFELEFQRPDGRKVYVLASVNAVRDESDRIIGARGILHDITEQKLLQQQLIQSQKMEAIGTLAGGIAHDFNNILAAIIGYAEMALTGLSGESRAFDDIQEVLQAANRARELVGQILTFSRQSRQQKQPVRISSILKEAYKMLRASIPANIDIKYSFSKSDVAVYADPTQIHQVIMNLCTNAYHAMREKGGVLSIELDEVRLPDEGDYTVQDLSPGNYVRLKVQDTGHGMDQDTMKRIFDPFFTTKSQGEGTGMGLSVVHGIVTDHGGKISVSSQPGKGATFMVYLPCISPQKETQPIDTSGYPGGSERILFIDDEESLVKIGKRQLEQFGYQVTGTTNGMDALQAFKEDPTQFDLIISDHTMPQQTGIELARKFLDIRSDIPIILITGFSELVDLQKIKELGIKELLYKPVSAVELGQKVRRVLDASGHPGSCSRPISGVSSFHQSHG